MRERAGEGSDANGRRQIDNVVGVAHNFKGLVGTIWLSRSYSALSFALYLLDTTMLCCALCAAAAA